MIIVSSWDADVLSAVKDYGEFKRRFLGKRKAALRSESDEQQRKTA